MPNDPGHDLITALEEVLDLERSALAAGDLDRLGPLIPQKEKLIGAINEMQVHDSEDLIRLQKKVERNQGLLNSASEGIRAVMDRMAELKKIRQEFTTYTASGQRNGFAVRQDTKLEKRA